MNRVSSIRSQLLRWLLTPILVLWLVGSAVTYGLAMAFATDAYDQALLDSLHSIASRISQHNGTVSVDLPPAALAILKDNYKDKLYYQVNDSKGNIIAGDTTVLASAFGKREEEDQDIPDFHDATINGQPVRVATVNFPIPGDPTQSVSIQIAETLVERQTLANRILIGVVLPELAIVVLSGLLVWFGVSRGLKPLNSLRDAIASRTPLDLRPIQEETVPREVKPLVRAINGLMKRLSNDIEAQRRFVANAAHQLRTPIAGLKTQTELAVRQSEPSDIKHALGLILTSATRAARLTNQLLALARSEPGIVDRANWLTVDINDVARNVIAEFVSQAVSKDIDLGFEGPSRSTPVKGDIVSLHELVSNLVENAVAYTKAGGHVTVRINDDNEHSILTVEDDGPGIPTDEREKVFERFYRLYDRSVSGSGLGLAIVREIATAHGATVTIDSGPEGAGTAVKVCFAKEAALVAR